MNKWMDSDISLSDIYSCHFILLYNCLDISHRENQQFFNRIKYWQPWTLWWWIKCHEEVRKSVQNCLNFGGQVTGSPMHRHDKRGPLVNNIIYFWWIIMICKLTKYTVVMLFWRCFLNITYNKGTFAKITLFNYKLL